MEGQYTPGRLGGPYIAQGGTRVGIPGRYLGGIFLSFLLFPSPTVKREVEAKRAFLVQQ